MRNFCVFLISLLSFNVAYCQSKISGTGELNNTPAPSNNDLAPIPTPGDEFENNSSNSAHRSVHTAFQPGVIITKDGDTLSGLIKYEYPVPSGKIIYRPDSSASDSIFSIDKVSSIITQYIYFKNIPFKGKATMMPWLAVGKINLYSHTKYYGTSTEVNYVLEKDSSQFVYINQKDFKIMMRHVFFDTPDMLEEIGKEGYKFDDMIKIVKEYNKGFK